MHNLLIYNLLFSTSFSFRWDAFPHCFVCAVLILFFLGVFLIYYTFVWRIELDILKFNRCAKEYRFEKENTRMRQFSIGYNIGWMIFFSIFHRVLFFSCFFYVAPNEAGAENKIQENSTFYYYVLHCTNRHPTGYKMNTFVSKPY